MTAAEHISDFEHLKDILYITHKGELCFFLWVLGENWPCYYNGTAPNTVLTFTFPVRQRRTKSFRRRITTHSPGRLMLLWRPPWQCKIWCWSMVSITFPRRTGTGLHIFGLWLRWIWEWFTGWNRWYPRVLANWAVGYWAAQILAAFALFFKCFITNCFFPFPPISPPFLLLLLYPVIFIQYSVQQVRTFTGRPRP